MTMVSTGPISLGGSATTGGLNQSVNIELGRGATTTITMNETAVRTLAGVPSGAISMNDFYGKADRVTINLTIAGNTQNYNIFSNKGGGYIAGKADVVLTINSGVIVGSSSITTFALETGTGWASGDTIKIINNGTIIGRAGNGGSAAAGRPFPTPGVAGNPGQGGGTGLRLQFATQIENNSIISGGGGGGGGGSGTATRGGGGGGGGAGNTVGSGGGASTGGGGQGGSSPGAAGTTLSGGNGGASTGAGGTGGGPGVNGGAGGSFAGGGGGGAGASGGLGSPSRPAPGGAAGAATNGGPTFATYLATGTRYGALN